MASSNLNSSAVISTRDALRVISFGRAASLSYRVLDVGHLVACLVALVLSFSLKTNLIIKQKTNARCNLQGSLLALESSSQASQPQNPYALVRVLRLLLLCCVFRRLASFESASVFVLGFGNTCFEVRSIITLKARRRALQPGCWSIRSTMALLVSERLVLCHYGCRLPSPFQGLSPRRITQHFKHVNIADVEASSTSQGLPCTSALKG